MRHERLGFPGAPAARVCGRPCRYWINLFLLCHRRGAAGWERLEWPDGGPLLAQPWPLVLAFRVIGDELAALAAEESRQPDGHPAWHGRQR